MNKRDFLKIILNASSLIFLSAFPSLAKSHKKNKDENPKTKGTKKREYFIENIYPNLTIESAEHQKLEGFVQPNKISLDIYKMAGILPGPPISEDTKIQKKRGMFKTGLKAKFHDNKKLVVCDDCWAINYSHKREGRPAYHKGRDLPMPFNEPVLAMANGTVVGLFENLMSRKGVEVVLRHTPNESKTPYYIYTQYTHFNKWPLDLKIGQKVKVGEVLGPNGNSGKKGKGVRRPALHFAAFYSQSPEWSFYERGFLVHDGYWMDPISFFRTDPPFDNKGIKKLESKQKETLIGYKTKIGKIVPEGAKKVWPFAYNGS
jgi:murein DD-endopeptidase MepM/ murein hydrolase activator NlpD